MINYAVACIRKIYRKEVMALSANGEIKTILNTKIKEDFT
jgi:hypothetical protein